MNFLSSVLADGITTQCNVNSPVNQLFKLSHIKP